MFHYKKNNEKSKSDKSIVTPLTGYALLQYALLNKDTAFTDDERISLNLSGKIPSQVETLEQQISRLEKQYDKLNSDLEKYIYLHDLHHRNQILFYKFVLKHFQDMLPILYTPTVGTLVKRYSHDFRFPQGLYINYTDQDRLADIFAHHLQPHIELVVVTDGERVLGIGDQGIGAIGISVAKAMVYTLCGGINPYHTLPIIMDVGTDNEVLLDDPLYLGLKQKRLRGAEYDSFIEKFVTLLKRNLPSVFLHWEDFGRSNARRLLDRYRHTICSFNDDMQGTAIVALAAILSAVKRKGQKLHEQRILIFGAGTAGTGIADQLVVAMSHEGLSPKEAQERFWLFDKQGLVLANDKVTDFQKPYARALAEIEDLEDTIDITLLENVVDYVKPTILIGCSAISGAFTENVVKKMYQHVRVPIILPLSNPNQKVEATPTDILTWTQADALVATGSPFPAVELEGKRYPIAQCNNALAFPGLGLGVMAVKAHTVTDGMLWAACQALSDFPGLDEQAPLLPSLNHAQLAARKIAIAVVEQARKEGIASCASDLTAEEALDRIIWEPEYLMIQSDSHS